MFWLFLTVCVVAFYYFRSPLPKAFAERRRQHGEAAHEEVMRTVAQLGDEVRALRDDMMEMAERLDFAERALGEVRRRPLAEQNRSE